jgi:Flp pilus assembly protein TadD/tRNA A-37 threonylcarbamoyl transferase component Bud32
LPAVPGFVVTHEIARGGMGVVYAAHDPAFEREVAVKVMHTGQDAERFVVESKVTARLPHPGIPPVYALGTLADGRPFLALKLIEGHTLADELKAEDRGSDLPRFLGVFEQICLTVGFAHSRDIVHRDLKPANVMVGRFGEVLVMDWGLAKELRNADCGLRIEDRTTAGSASSSVFNSAIRNPQSAIEETVAGQVKGTPAYMAPEQARGEPVDARADVFALGGILAVVLTGKPPFLGDTVLDTVKRAARADVAECFAQLDACGIDAELIAVAKKCLAAKVDNRLANGEAVAAAVAAYRAGVEERLRRAERDRAVSDAEAREQRKRRKVQLALAAVVALFLTVGGAFAWHSDRQASERKLKEELAEAERKAERDRAAAERKASEARLAGERDAEHRLKAEQARRGVAANLKLATDLRKQYKFAEAEAALVQAAALAAGGATELRPVVEQARADLAFVVKLDDIRFRKWVWIATEGGTGHFNEETAPPEYRRAFAERGLDPTALNPADAALRIASSAVKAELVAAVDDWALYEPDATLRDRLLEVARKADPGVWTDRLRTPAVRSDRAEVAKLAAAADPSTTPAALSVLAVLMQRHGLDPSPLLSAARAKHPTDFELAFVLGRWHTLNSKEVPSTKREAIGREIGPYEAARALRPGNVTVWLNLGVALHARGDATGALAAWREAVRLDPTDAIARYNLGWALYAKGDVDGAIAEYREAVKLDPKYARAHYDLGVALNDRGDVTAAIDAWKQAARCAPGDARTHTNLGSAYAQRGNNRDAIACARAALRADPNYANAHALLGLILLQTGDVSGARAALTEAARLDPKKWAAVLAQVALPVAPAPREVKR